jgi:hypothetical protein
VAFPLSGRRTALVAAFVSLVVALVGAVWLAPVQAAQNPPKPKPALPIGPGPFHPLDSFGSSATDDVVLHWNDQALAAIRTRPAPPPPVSARALAIMNTSMYNAWAAYDATAAPTVRAGWTRRPVEERTFERKSMAISFAAHRALTDLFPALADTFSAFLTTRLGYTAPVTAQPDDPAAVGIAAANAVIASRTDDGSNQANGYAETAPFYEPSNPPKELSWQPSLLGQTRFVVAHWYRVRPFALASPSQFLPPGPMLRTSDGSYSRAIDEMIRYSATLKDSDKVKAEYWSDGPQTEQPPGHWMLFTGAIARKNGYSLDQNVKLHFAVSNALFDAGIAAWNAKRTYDFIRPVMAVRTLKAGTTIRAWAGPGAGTQFIPAEKFQSYIPTPSFPDYVSGHSTFSSAAGRILRTFTGSDSLNMSATIGAGTSVVEPNQTPSRAVRLVWPTFTDAVQEAGESRMIGGIHFRDANLDGITLGTSVGSNTWSKAQTYFSGIAN